MDNSNKMMESNSDRISSLPTDLTDIILSKLPIAEAARTSILSKKWRSNWLSLPNLTISDFVFRRQQSLNVVNQILIQHSGSISSFTLSVYKFETLTNIELWIRYLSMQGLTEFSLQIQNTSHWYKLNSALLDFQTLVTLKLRYCDIEIPLEFIGLNSLIRLELNDVSFGDDGLAILTEKCPLLKYLSLGEIYGGGGDGYLNILAPRLEVFVFGGSCLKSISFKTKSLVHASIGVSKLPQSLQPAHLFSLKGGYLMYFKIMWEALKTKPCILSNIQHLRFDEFNIQESIQQSSALSLIANSPNLNILSISFEGSILDQYRVGYVGKLSDIEKRSFSASKLKSLHIKGFEGRGCEMEFVELVLSKSPLLESIVIKAERCISIDDSQKMLKELTRFGSAAPYAQLTFLDSKDKKI